MVNVTPIHNLNDYEMALARVEQLMDASAGTPEGDELDILTTLIESYEDMSFPMDIPDAVTAIRFIMDQQGLEQKDFAALIGKSRASEILRKKRTLSLGQARLLHKEWGVPASALLAG